MKSKTLCITTLTLLTALSVPLQLAAQDNQDHNHHKHHHYQFIDLGTFGWENGSIVDLNTLVYGNSQIFLYWSTFIGDSGDCRLRVASQR